MIFSLARSAEILKSPRRDAQRLVQLDRSPAALTRDPLGAG
jgi:hypothetical protein